MYVGTDENDYDSSHENDIHIDLEPDIVNEYEYNRKIDIVKFYRDKLYKEPEFIGIKNISSFLILYIIETTNLAYKLYTKDHRVTTEQIIIFDDMYKELFNKKSTIDIYNYVTKKIFSYIYVN